MVRMGVREGVPPRAGKGTLRRLESDGHDILRPEAILFEKKEEACKLGTEIKWTRSRKPVDRLGTRAFREKTKDQWTPLGVQQRWDILILEPIN